MSAGAVSAAKGVLLCAGLGTRLRPLTDERPKPLLPVCNVPIVRYGLANLRRAGIATVGVNLHAHGPQLRAELGDEVIYADEPTVLGTGGALAPLAKAIDLGTDDLIVHNGKLVFDVDLVALLAHHRKTQALATMVVRKVADAREWGAIDVDEAGRVRNILQDGEYMFCGVHVLRADFIDALPLGESDSIRQGYIPLLQRGAVISAFPATGYFAEHSTPERYAVSNFALLRGAQVPQATWPLTDGQARLVHPTAQVAKDVELGTDVVVGPSAVVADGARLQRVVVWSHARVSGSLQDAIVTPRTVVKLAQ